MGNFIKSSTDNLQLISSYNIENQRYDCYYKDDRDYIVIVTHQKCAISEVLKRKSCPCMRTTNKYRFSSKAEMGDFIRLRIST
jgi:hypothetical protein